MGDASSLGARATRLLRLALVVGGMASLGLLVAESVAAADPTPTPTASVTAAPSGDAPASEAPGTSLVPVAQDACVKCHVAIDDTQAKIAEEWTASAHGQAGVGCAGCHGGDPTSDEVTVAMSTEAGYIGKPDRTRTVEVCGTCHSDIAKMRKYQLPTDQLAKYRTSVHGQKLFDDRDTRVAICTDCHGVHDVKKASDPTADVYPLNVPKLCASCHADERVMKPYGIPTNQLEVYEQSVHGQALTVEQDLRAPTCVSCHGSHDAKPPQSSEVVGVCGKCHTATQALYEQSRHAKLQAGPKCWTCHGTHDVAKPDESRFLHPTPPEVDCTTCHDPGDRSLKLNADRFVRDQDRRCDTCHHAGSLLYAQADGIRNALTKASDAYDAAEARIAEAAGAGMIVSDADVTLSEALTGLIRGRAESHTTKLSAVAALTDEAEAKAQAAKELADAALQESTDRRQAMVVVVALIIFNVLVLFVLRRNLYRKSPE